MLLTPIEIQGILWYIVFKLIFFIFSGHEGVMTDTFRGPGSAVAEQRNNDLYEHVLTAAAIFTLTLAPDAFSLAEDTILRNVLQPNPWKATLATDLWCLVARSVFHYLHRVENK